MLLADGEAHRVHQASARVARDEERMVLVHHEDARAFAILDLEPAAHRAADIGHRAAEHHAAVGAGVVGDLRCGDLGFDLAVGLDQRAVDIPAVGRVVLRARRVMAARQHGERCRKQGGGGEQAARRGSVSERHGGDDRKSRGRGRKTKSTAPDDRRALRVRVSGLIGAGRERSASSMTPESLGFSPYGINPWWRGTSRRSSTWSSSRSCR